MDNNTTTFTFEISFSQDYQSESQLYRRGIWYNIPRSLGHPGITSQEKARNEARDLAKSFHEVSGVALDWRVVREEVVETGGSSKLLHS